MQYGKAGLSRAHVVVHECAVVADLASSGRSGKLEQTATSDELAARFWGTGQPVLGLGLLSLAAGTGRACALLPWTIGVLQKYEVA